MTSRKRKIIFVGGTVRSGTTLLNLIVANEENSLALGEIFWVFNPIQKKHVELIDTLKKDRRWKAVIAGGKERLYENLKRSFPEIDVFVDSSKDPFWIEYHTRLNENDFDIRSILIFKSPEEFAQSKLKRGEKNWAKVYVNYHRRYLSLIESFTSISYFELVNDNRKFAKAMNWLGLSERIGKKRYWEVEHLYNFFGSGSISKVKSNRENKNLREEILYDNVKDPSVFEAVNSEKKVNVNISKVYKYLSDDRHQIPKGLRYSQLSLGVLRFKDSVLIRILRFRNQRAR